MVLSDITVLYVQRCAGILSVGVKKCTLRSNDLTFCRDASIISRIFNFNKRLNHLADFFR